MKRNADMAPVTSFLDRITPRPIAPVMLRLRWSRASNNRYLRRGLKEWDGITTVAVLIIGTGLSTGKSRGRGWGGSESVVPTSNASTLRTLLTCRVHVHACTVRACMIVRKKDIQCALSYWPALFLKKHHWSGCKYTRKNIIKLEGWLLFLSL